jgi:hypothetical protein
MWDMPAMEVNISADIIAIIIDFIVRVFQLFDGKTIWRSTSLKRILRLPVIVKVFLEMHMPMSMRTNFRMAAIR